MKAQKPVLAAILRGALTALLFFAHTTHAQRIEKSVDAGWVALRYADTLSTSAAAVTPHILADWPNAAVDGWGTLSQFTSGGWSSQGALSASLFTLKSRDVVGELGGFAGGSAHQDGTRTGEVLGNGRLHFVRRNGEVFFGAGGGIRSDGGAWGSVFQGEAGVALNFGAAGALLTINPVVVNDSIRYTDGQVSLFWTSDKLDLAALIGTRFGDQLTSLSANTKSWASFSAVGWMTPHLGLVAGGGTYPVDPTQGFPGGRFVSLSVRLATGRNRTALPPGTQQNSLDLRSDDVLHPVAGFVAGPSSYGFVTLRVNAPRAQLVEISGDFTNWVPVQLQPSGGGWWAATLPMNPGKYQMNLRIDGGKWLVPPGLLSMLDEFGGTVGLLVVERNTKM
ncbi:MAG: glycogen-binding domain-containing protein [Gemmatimonadota bacterium]|nr:glycogen-binding domain-containing protein [Gemmatimonadota bacterium]